MWRRSTPARAAPFSPKWLSQGRSASSARPGAPCQRLLLEAADHPAFAARLERLPARQVAGRFRRRCAGRHRAEIMRGLEAVDDIGVIGASETIDHERVAG